MPTTTGIATEFIQFTRASNATVTDSDGKVKWAPHNLLTNSESFDAASWTKTNTTVSANAISAPNGTTTADAVYETTANGNHWVLQSNTFNSTATSFTAGVFARANGRDWVLLSIYDGVNEFGRYFQLTGTGTVGLRHGSTGSVDGIITSVGDGWYYCTIATTIGASGGGNFAIATATANGTNSFVGDITKGVYLWGASLYRSDLAMQPNTSAYPLYNPTTPKNLLGYTEDFSNAAWGSFNTTKTINQLTLTSTSGGATQSKTLVSGGVYTLQCKIKKGTNNFAYLNVQGGFVYASAVFDLVNGVTGETKVVGAGFAVSSHTISTADTDGYFTCRATFTVAAANVVVVGFAPAATGNTFDGYGNPTGCTSGNTLFVKQAQLSDSASLDSYVPVYGAAVTSAAYYGPRRDFDGATLACKGLLVEEQRSNLLLYSAAFNDGVYWVPSNANVVVNGIASPDGTTTGDKLEETAVSGQHLIYQTTTNANGTYTFSVWLKAAERTRAIINMSDNLTGGASIGVDLSTASTFSSGIAVGSWTAISSSITPWGNSWYRVSITGTRGAGTQTLGMIYLVSTGTTISYLGVANSGMWMYGAQLEDNASFPTSYIPTGSASATRNADVPSVSAQAFPYSASTGSLVVNYNYIGSSTTPYPIALDSGSLVTFFGVNHTASLLGTDQGGVSISPVLNATGLNKVASAYAANDRAVSANSNSANTSASSYTPGTATTLSIGSLANSASYRMNGHIRQITYLPRRISNADLVTRST